MNLPRGVGLTSYGGNSQWGPGGGVGRTAGLGILGDRKSTPRPLEKPTFRSRRSSLRRGFDHHTHEPKIIIPMLDRDTNDLNDLNDLSDLNDLNDLNAGPKVWLG